jgi:hypothetical protein
MRKLFFGLAVLAVVVVVMGSWRAVSLWRGFSTIGSETKTYVDDAVVEISGHWDKDALMRRASSGLKKTVSARPQALESLFTSALAGLGDMVRYKGASGSVTMKATTETGTTVSGKYTATADYQNGPATLRLGLLKEDGAWTIDSFSVDLPTLQHAQAGGAAATPATE